MTTSPNRRRAPDRRSYRGRSPALAAGAALVAALCSTACEGDRPVVANSLFGCWTPEGATAPKLCFGAAAVPQPNEGASAFAWWDDPTGEPAYNREFELGISDRILVLHLDASPFQRCAKAGFEGDTLLLSEFKDADGKCDPAVASATPNTRWIELE